MDDPIHWCIVAIAKKGWLFTAHIPELFAYKAQEQGWSVLARDSEMPSSPYTPLDPHQSNPRRDVDDADGA